jgi:hypothetical protein
LYAPPSQNAPLGYSVTGNLARAGSTSVRIGVDSHDHQVYVLVMNPGDNTYRGVGCALNQALNTVPTNCAGGWPMGPSSGGTGGCTENAPPASNQANTPTVIQPWDDFVAVKSPNTFNQGQTGQPYMTLFVMDPTTGYLTYQATIKIDDHNATMGSTINAANTLPGNTPMSSVLPNAREMIVESGFRGCDNKGRHGPDLGEMQWNPQAGVGGAFMVAIPNVLNNPPICYIASLNNLCGPPTTSATVITATNASTTAPVPPGPGAFAQNFMGQSYIPGPWLVNGDPSQGGYPAGGCIYPTPNPATNNLIGSVNNQANGGFEWDCDGALALIDPFYVYKGPKQPNILTLYPEYSIPVGQPYDGYTNATLQIPCTVVGGVIQINTPPNCGNTYLQNLANCKTATPTLCPNGLASPGPIGVVYACGDQTLPAYVIPPTIPSPAITPPATPCTPSQGSIGGVVYLPYCSPGSLALGPTDVPGGYDGKGAGDVSSLTTPSTGRNTTFANILLGCNPFYNGNNSGTGQGQLTTNIQENYSLALNTISATSNPTFGCATGVLGVGCRSASQPSFATNPSGSSAFNDFVLPGPYPAVDPVPLFAHYNNNVNTPVPAGCTAQYPAVPPTNGGGTCGGTHPFVPPNAVSGPPCSTTTCPVVTGNQVMAGTINGPNNFNAATNINGVTEARLNFTNITKDPHWYVAVGGRGWSAANINPTPNAGGLATRGPVIGYLDALTNQVVEYTPTSSGSNTIALDEQNYVAFLPVNGVQYSGLPAGDFTGNGARLCGNTTTKNGLTTGPGCIIVFRQQYLSPLGSGAKKGN